MTPNDSLLVRLLYRVTRVSRRSLDEYAKFTRGVDVESVNNNPRDFRLYVFDLTARAKMVQTVNIEDSASLPFVGFHLVRLVSGDSTEFVAAVPIHQDDSHPPALPTRWPMQEEIDEPVTLQGFFMARRDFNPDSDDEKAIDNLIGLRDTDPPIFVANRLQWFPEANDSVIPVTDSELLLARHGVDIGRLETVRSNIAGSISLHETESFFQMLAATRTMSTDELPTGLIGFKESLTQPRANQGNAIAVFGHVRRATKINIEDSEIRRRHGIDHYFQLDLFVPLDNQRIVIKPAAVENESAMDNDSLIVQDNRFPVAVCVTGLPCSESEILRRQVFVRGFFFKQWNYDSEMTLQTGPTTRQISPLVIGLGPELVELPTDFLTLFVTVGGVLFIVGTAALIWYMRSAAVDSRPRRGNELPERIDVAHLDPH